MAQAGFPWHSQSRDPEKKDALATERIPTTQAEENKPREDPNTLNKNTSSTQTFQPRKHSSAQRKPRSGSVKGPPRVKPAVFSSSSETSAPKATSPLPVRTIPPWVRDAEEDDLEDPQFQFPDTPHSALVAEHHHSPSTARRHLLSGQQASDQGFLTSSGQVRPERTSRWITFARTSAYPRENYNNEKVDSDWLNQNFTDYSKPWLADHDDDDAEDSSSRYRAFRRKRQAWYKRAQFTILRSPFIPFAFRMIVLSFALVALGLGASIYHETGKIVHCIRENERSDDCRDLVGDTQTDYYRDPSGLMAVIVDAIAIVYTIYITYDEYFSKPLGLRSARAKVRLVLLDLFFVIFQSANLSLSFESLTVDEGACKVGDTPRTSTRFDNVCARAQALSGVLTISLVAWTLTFSVSILRLVERIDTK